MYKNALLSDFVRTPVSSFSSAFSKANIKSPMNQPNEYWYIGSTLARSATQKNNCDARNATGM
jgi:hypothetical protein